jgi:hypothetical protein
MIPSTNQLDELFLVLLDIHNIIKRPNVPQTGITEIEQRRSGIANPQILLATLVHETILIIIAKNDGTLF